MEKVLKEIYFDPKNPGSYGSVRNLYLAARAVLPDITLKTVKLWLSGQDSFTLNRSVRRQFKRSRLISSGLFSQADIDLADVSNLAKSNDGVRFLLVAIDAFSRKLYVQPLQSKQSIDVVKAMKVLWELDPMPKLIRSDSGKEFLNARVSSFFKRHNIHSFTSSNDVKCHLVERVIRTLRSRIHRYITHTQQERYIDHLQHITRAYNNRIHTTIGIAPSKVTRSNSKAVWWTQFWPQGSSKPKPYLYEIGNHVRVSYLRTAFSSREADHRFSGEIFRVIGRTRRDNIPVYRLVDLADEPIKGTFYAQELTKVTPQDEWKVETVIRTRKRRGYPKESLVKWLHYPDKFNSWISSASIVDL